MSRKKYTEKERREALRIYEAGRANGLTAHDAAHEAGVPYITLRTWQVKNGKQKTEKLRKDIADILTSPVKPVTVTPPKRTELTGPRLVMTNGMKVYGPIDELIEVLKAVKGRP